jgi:MFS family permease
MFMAGRLLSGVGVAVAANAAPSYVTEMSPPQWRGRMGGMYNVSSWDAVQFLILIFRMQSWYYAGASKLSRVQKLLGY